MNKQIYAVLEINDSEIRILVGEFFNIKLNVIKVERVPCKGISNFKIMDPEKVIKSLKQCLENASKAIGANIESVILVLPSVNFKKISLKTNVTTDTGIINYNDLKQVYKEAYNANVDDNFILANVVMNKFTVNNINYRRLPVKEIAKNFTVHYDLLYINKKIAYDYVTVCEASGLKILDLCLDTYAIAKEAVLLEKAIEQNILLIKIDNQCSTFSFLSKGQIQQQGIIRYGVRDLIDAIFSKYQFDISEISKIIKYDYVHDDEKCSDDVVKMWNDGDLKLSLTQRQISNIVRPVLNRVLKNIYELIEPINEYGLDSIYLVSEGSKIQALVSEMKNKYPDIEVNTYAADKIGARDSSLCACLGAFYVFEETLTFKNDKPCSIDLLQFNSLMQKQIDDEDKNTITIKMKKFLNKEGR